MRFLKHILLIFMAIFMLSCGDDNCYEPPTVLLNVSVKSKEKKSAQTIYYTRVEAAGVDSLLVNAQSTNSLVFELNPADTVCDYTISYKYLQTDEEGKVDTVPSTEKWRFHYSPELNVPDKNCNMMFFYRLRNIEILENGAVDSLSIINKNVKNKGTVNAEIFI